MCNFLCNELNFGILSPCSCPLKVTLILYTMHLMQLEILQLAFYAEQFFFNDQHKTATVTFIISKSLQLVLLSK